MKNDKLATMKKKTFLQRLLRCTKGDSAVVVGIVLTGLGVSAAAVVGSRTTSAVGTATNTISQRAAQGANGTAPLAR